MEIRHNEIEIYKENPFANCKLGREGYANVLTEIVNTYAKGFVLAINNEWGTGKTTFVKMWQQVLENKNFQTIYFNAWENDFDDNPIVALMAELKSLSNAKSGKVFKSVIEKGAILAKNVLPALGKALAKKYIDIDVVTDAIENTTKGTTEILEKEIDEYITKKKTVLEFKEELGKFIKKTEIDNPLVFIIDELDRCRPDYAVEVLEQVKHFFSVPGIVFVLSIDKKHLASSIKGYYGCDDINTDEYLRRFIDLEYSIPKPSIKSFCKYLYDYYSFDDFYSSDERKKYREFDHDKEWLLKMAELLFDISNATLRQQEKIFALTRLILSSFHPTQYTFSNLLFVLIYLKTMKNQLYERIRNKSYNLQELCDVFENLFLVDSRTELFEYKLDLPYIEAHLLYLYNIEQENLYKNREELFGTDDKGKQIFLLKSRFGKDLERSVAERLTRIGREYNYRELGLSFLLNKIDLIEHVNK